MLGRFAKRLALLALSGVGLSLASCSSTGFAGAIYMSPDGDGKRSETAFYSDYTDTPSIFVIIPIVSGRNDETLTVSVKVKRIYNDDVTSVFRNPIIVSQVAPGVQTKPSNIAVQFPDPLPIQVQNPADPLNPLQVKPPRAPGNFQFIATMNGDTETVNFVILPPLNQPLPDPNAGTPQAEPPAGTCQAGAPPSGNVTSCPPPAGAHAIQCCTAAQSCGTGVEGTGLCF